ILYGNEDMEERSKRDQRIQFEGIINFLGRHSEDSSAAIQRWAQSFMNKKTCPECEGTRLKKEALNFRIGDEHIGTLAGMDLSELQRWFDEVESRLDKDQQVIATEILKEIRARLGFILEVGLDYLTLH